MKFYKIFSNENANSTTFHFGTASDEVIVCGRNLKIKLSLKELLD